MMTEAEAIDSLGELFPVSHETIRRLTIYEDLLKRWQKSQNLVAPTTLGDVWRRHFLDSLQALAACPTARRWADLGSGAGFPGLVTAIVLAELDAGEVHLVESNRGKAAFLRAVIRETGARAVVHAERVEAFTAAATVPFDAVSSRALAPLADLLALAEPLLAAGAWGVFHKGQDFASEIEKATQSWSLDLVELVSRVDPTGRILVIRRAARR